MAGNETSNGLAKTPTVASPLGEPGEDGPPGRIGQGGEGPVQGVFVILNHSVNYKVLQTGVKCRLARWQGRRAS